MENLHGPLLVLVLQSKFPDELNLINKRQLDDNDYRDNTVVLNLLKLEINAGEKTFGRLSDSNEKYTGASLHISKYFPRQVKKPTSLL